MEKVHIVNCKGSKIKNQQLIVNGAGYKEVSGLLWSRRDQLPIIQVKIMEFPRFNIKEEWHWWLKQKSNKIALICPDAASSMFS